MVDLEIIKRIKDLREFCDMTVDEIANALDITPQEYEEYESGARDLPIGTLYNIAAVLKIDANVLLTGKMSNDTEATVVYEGKGLKVERYEGYNFTSLANEFIDRLMEPMIVELKSGIIPELVVHKGQEFNYVLKGSIRVLLGNKEYCLKEGDSIYFNPLIPHAQVSITDSATFLTVITEEQKK